MAITREEFKKLSAQGLSDKEIVRFEKWREAKGLSTQESAKREPVQEKAGIQSPRDYFLPQLLSGATMGGGERTFLGDIFERPGAAIRSALMGQGYKQGALYPENVPTFQQKALETMAPNTASTMVNFLGGLPASSLGFAADIATNPAEILTTVLGGGSSGKLKGTKIGEFATKERSTPRQIFRKYLSEGGVEGKRQSLKWQMEDLNKKSTQAISEIRNVSKSKSNIIRDSIKEADSLLSKTIDEKAIKIQKQLPAWFKENSEVYGNTLDNIAETLSKSKKPFTLQNADDIISSSIGELDNELLLDGLPRRLLNRLARKYSSSPIEETVSSGLLDSFGKPITHIETARNPNLVIDFREFYEDIKKVGKAISSQLKSGQRFMAEDIAYAVLKKNVGNFASSRIPEFVALQKEYAPVVQSMKVAGRLFKPYGGDFSNISGATGVLRRMALGKATPQEAEFINMLQKGNSLSRGLGDITSDIVSMGQQRANSIKALGQVKDTSYKSIQAIKQETGMAKSGITAKQRELASQILRKKKVDAIKKKAFIGIGLTAGALFRKKILPYLK